MPFFFFIDLKKLLILLFNIHTLNLRQVPKKVKSHRLLICRVTFSYSPTTISHWRKPMKEVVVYIAKDGQINSLRQQGGLEWINQVAIGQVDLDGTDGLGDASLETSKRKRKPKQASRHKRRELKGINLFQYVFGFSLIILVPTILFGQIVCSSRQSPIFILHSHIHLCFFF